MACAADPSPVDSTSAAEGASTAPDERLAPLLRVAAGPGAILGEPTAGQLARLAGAGLDVASWPRISWTELRSGLRPGASATGVVAFLPAAEETLTASQAEALSALMAVGGIVALASATTPGVAAARREASVLLEAAFLPLPSRTAVGEPPADLRLARRERHRLRSYAAGDEAAILDLFRRCFHVDRGAPRWRWLYRENPWGGPNISLAVDERGAPVAHYAAYPVRFLRAADGAPRVAWGQQVGDTMTAPEVRSVGRGGGSLLGRCVQHFYSTCCHDRIDFNYGFNTGNIQRFSRMFVGAEVAEAVRYRRLAGPDLERLRRPPGLGSRLLGLRVERTRRVGAEWTRLLATVAGPYRFLVQRDADYLEWRYLRCPDVDYSLLAVRRFGRLVGWGAFRRIDDRLVWGDALFRPSAAGAAEVLLRAAVAAEVGAGATTVEGWFPDRPAFWDATLRRLGFRDAPEPQELALVYVPFRDADPGPALRSELYYTWGDSDLF